MPVAPVGQLFVAIGVSLKYIDWVAQFQLFARAMTPVRFLYSGTCAAHRAEADSKQAGHAGGRPAPN